MPALIILADLDRQRPEIPREQLTDGEIAILARLRGGTQSGKSTVAAYVMPREPLFRADGTQVTHILAETTLALFNGAHAVFSGAERRDADECRRN